MRHSLLLVFLYAVATCVDERPAVEGGASRASIPGRSQVSVIALDDRVRVLFDGKPFVEYVFRGYSRPIVYPIIGPHGLGMTRSWPMRDGVAGESHDHPHQKAMYVGFGAVNGVNFFAESPDAGESVDSAAPSAPAQQAERPEERPDEKPIEPQKKEDRTGTMTVTQTPDAGPSQAGSFFIVDGPSEDERRS